MRYTAESLAQEEGPHSKSSAGANNQSCERERDSERISRRQIVWLTLPMSRSARRCHNCTRLCMAFELGCPRQSVVSYAAPQNRSALPATRSSKPGELCAPCKDPLTATNYKVRRHSASHSATFRHSNKKAQRETVCDMIRESERRYKIARVL